jgi:hypothetical protein
MNNQPRTAHQVINDAIMENRIAEWIMYGFATAFVITGIALLILGSIKDNTFTGALGGVSSLLFWPSMTAARRVRKENIAIRLLEAPLGRADTAKEAAEMLRHLVSEVLSDSSKD